MPKPNLRDGRAGREKDGHFDIDERNKTKNLELFEKRTLDETHFAHESSERPGNYTGQQMPRCQRVAF